MRLIHTTISDLAVLQIGNPSLLCPKIQHCNTYIANHVTWRLEACLLCTSADSIKRRTAVSLCINVIFFYKCYPDAKKL
jgi:hypothetical protein